MPSHVEWHNKLCCNDNDHPQLTGNQGMEIVVPEMWQKVLDLDLATSSGRALVTVTSLIAMAGRNKSKTIGGALFTNPTKWVKVMPNSRSARWQVLGGVDFRLREIAQQSAKTAASWKIPTLEEEAQTAARMQELMDQQVYEEVPDSPEAEEKAREEVRNGKWREGLKSSRQCSHIWATAQMRAGKRGASSSQTMTPTQKRVQRVLQDTKSILETRAEKQEEKLQVQQEQEQLQHQATAQVIYSPCYTILKSDGVRRRLLHNLKVSSANLAVWPSKHKQEGVKQLQGVIKPGDRFIGWDFRDAFHQVLIQPRYRRMMRTSVWMQHPHSSRWVERRLQNRTLGQGFRCSPELMTKMIVDLLKVWRSLGIRCFIKIDDLIAVVSSIKEGLLVAYVMTRLLIELGAVFSEEKCAFGMSTRMKWCGMVFCSVAQVTFLPEEKVEKLVGMMKELKKKLQCPEEHITLREIQRVIGTLISAMEGVAEARLMVLEAHGLRRWIMLRTNMDWDQTLMVSELPKDKVSAVIAEVHLWTRNYDADNKVAIAWNGKLVYSDPPEAVIFTDACSRAGGVWVEETKRFPEIDMNFPLVGAEIHEHITYQETAAAADGLVHTLVERDYRMCTVAMKIDATAAIKYMKCSGGKKLALARRVWDSVKETRRRRVYVGSNNDFGTWHVQGKKNPADKPSRKNVGFSEWRMNKEVFEVLDQKWGPFGLDAFAAAWNCQLPRYLCRQKWDRQALGYDALLHPYHQEKEVVWAFPPPHKDLTMRFLRTIENSGATAVVIMPMAQNVQVAAAIKMAVQLPVLMHCSSTLLVEPEAYSAHAEKEEFQDWKEARQWWTKRTWSSLIGVILSGDVSKHEERRRSWQKQLNSRSSQTQMEKGARILTEHTRAFWLTSKQKLEKMTRDFLWLSQMLCSEI